MATSKVAPAPSKLTPKQWAEIEALWEAGTLTLEDLSKKYGKAVSTFTRHFKAKGTKRGSALDEAKQRAAEALKRNAAGDAAILAARIFETKDESYKMQTAIQRLFWNEVLIAKNNGVDIATRMPNIKAIKEISAGLSIVRSEKFAILGLDRPDATDPSELPELFVTELTAQEIKELRDRDITELDDIVPAQIALDDAPDDEIVDESDS